MLKTTTNKLHTRSQGMDLQEITNLQFKLMDVHANKVVHLAPFASLLRLMLRACEDSVSSNG